MAIAKMLMSGVLAALTTTAIADDGVMASAPMEEALEESADVASGESFVADDHWQQIGQDISYIIPRGRTYTHPLDFSSNPLFASQLYVQTLPTQSNNCWANVEAVSINHNSNPNDLTRYPVDTTGVVTLNQKSIQKITYHFYQTHMLNSQCLVRLSALVADAPAPVEFELGGAFSYQGGFRHRMYLELSKSISQFWLRIPAHCTGVEVLEAGTTQRGTYVPARLLDASQHIYQVNTTATSRAESLTVSLNGPMGQACDIPVYILPYSGN